MKYILSLLFFISLSLGAAYAQMNKIEFVEYTLDNGLHVILSQDRSTPIVAVTMSYHVGSKNEKPGRTGFAHFFEHLLFEGSENIDRGQIDKYIQNAGGALNAFTTQDRTVYFEILPSNQINLGLWIESERMLHAKVDIKGVETQREVVKEEKRQRYDNRPYGTVLLEALSHSFKKHPYQWSPIGSMDDLNAAEESDFKQFYKDFYVPNNAVLSISGDLDIESTKMMIDLYFKDIPRSEKPVFRPSIVEPELTGEVRDTIYDNIQLPAVIQSYRIPAQGTPDFYAVSLLSTLLADGPSSRLSKALVDEQQKALFVGNFPLSLEDPSISIAFGIASMGVDVTDLEAAMDAEVARVQNELIDDREFQKLKNKIENDFILDNSGVQNRAATLANYHLFFGDANLINTEIDKYLAVSKEDIQRVAKKYFSKDNRATLHYLPKGDKL
ncbi:MAG: zinc protease [Saprospiraceae bacterium]|jgi:zinc protease